MVRSLQSISSHEQNSYKLTKILCRCGRKRILPLHRRARKYNNTVENPQATPYREVSRCFIHYNLYRSTEPQEKFRRSRIVNGEGTPETEQDPKHNHMIMMRILGPIITFVNRPWKVNFLVLSPLHLTFYNVDVPCGRSFWIWYVSAPS